MSLVRRGGRGSRLSAASGAHVEGRGLPEIGGLILRGNRCVLIRSLKGEWMGMRIPSMEAEPGELPAVTALCVASEVCDIEPEDVEVLHGIPPVNSYAVRRGKMRPIAVHALYAVNPPPAGPLEAADVEDPEDNYDWYTFPRAMAALAKDDQFARAALATMAVALAAAAAAGAVPDKWGGVFGQEWVGGAFRSIPSVPAGGLVLERTGLEFVVPAVDGAASGDEGAIAMDTGNEGSQRRAPPAKRRKREGPVAPARLGRAARARVAGLIAERQARERVEAMINARD